MRCALSILLLRAREGITITSIIAYDILHGWGEGTSNWARVTKLDQTRAHFLTTRENKRRFSLISQLLLRNL